MDLEAEECCTLGTERDDLALLMACPDTSTTLLVATGTDMCESVTNATVDGVEQPEERTSVDLANCCLSGINDGSDVDLLKTCPNGIGLEWDDDLDECRAYDGNGDSVMITENVDGTMCCDLDFWVNG